MSDDRKDEKFIFLGKFNIPYVLSVKIIDKKLDIIKELDEKLPKFEEGTSSSQGEGYFVHKNFESTEFLEENPELNEIFRQLEIIDYNFENYGNVRVFKKGRFVIEKRRVNIGVNSIYWILPNLLIIKGSGATSERFKASFKNIFKNKIILDFHYTFDPWFLIWIIYKYRKEEFELDDNFYIDLIWDMKVEGSEQTYIGKSISAKGSINVTKSLSILFPLLQKLIPTEIMFSFTINSLIGTIRINKDGSILIFLTRGVMSEISPIDRVVTGCYFVKRLIKLYEKWVKLTKKERIAPPEFIEDIVRECDSKGIEITSDVMETKEMYKEKRK